jgi:hypothetical protein
MNTPKFELEVEQAAEDICNLMDQLGFSSENRISPNDLKQMIVGIIQENLNSVPLIVVGTKGVPFQTDPQEEKISENQLECGCAGHEINPPVFRGHALE